MTRRWKDRIGMLVAALVPLAVGLALLAPVAPPSTLGVPNLEQDGLGVGAAADRARSVAALMIDDGLYYLQIARNLALGAGSTFDGMHATNGYHPLWLLGLAAWITVVAPAGASTSLLLLAYALQLLLSGVSGALLYRIARHLVSPVFALLAVVIWLRIVLVHRLPWSGMEYGLQLALLLWVIDRWLALTARDELALPAPRPLAILGTAALLATLARLDNLAFAGALGLVLVVWLAVRGPGRPAWIGVLAYATPLILGLGGYLAVNQVLFGLPTPVSGMLKHDWSQALLQADPRYVHQGFWVAKLDTLFWPLFHQSRSWGVPMIVGSLGAGLAAAIAAIVPSTRNRAWRWLPLAGFAAVQLVVHTLWNHGGFSHQPWYFAAQPVSTALLVALGFAVTSGKIRRHRTIARFAPWVVCSLLVLVAASIVDLTGQARDRLRRFGEEPLYAGARWARVQVTHDEVVGSWNAGMIAFLSGRTVVNLDGLVNDRSFYRHGRHDLCGYLDQERIRWLIDVGDETGHFYDLPQLAPCADRLDRAWLAGRGGRRVAAWRVGP